MVINDKGSSSLQSLQKLKKNQVSNVSKVQSKIGISMHLVHNLLTFSAQRNVTSAIGLFSIGGYPNSTLFFLYLWQILNTPSICPLKVVSLNSVSSLITLFIFESYVKRNTDVQITQMMPFPLKAFHWKCQNSFLFFFCFSNTDLSQSFDGDESLFAWNLKLVESNVFLLSSS